jgi:hypothetical protein
MNIGNNKSPAPVDEKMFKSTLRKQSKRDGKANPLAYRLTWLNNILTPQIDSRYALLCSKSKLQNKTKEIEELLTSSNNLEEKLNSKNI